MESRFECKFAKIVEVVPFNNTLDLLYTDIYGYINVFTIYLTKLKGHRLASKFGTWLICFVN